MGVPSFSSEFWFKTSLVTPLNGAEIVVLKKKIKARILPSTAPWRERAGPSLALGLTIQMLFFLHYGSEFAILQCAVLAILKSYLA